MFPSAGSLVRLAGAVLCWQDETWQESRCFSGARMIELYDDGRVRGVDGPFGWARLEAEDDTRQRRDAVCYQLKGAGTLPAPAPSIISAVTFREVCSAQMCNYSIGLASKLDSKIFFPKLFRCDDCPAIRIDLREFFLTSLILFNISFVAL